VIPHEIKTTVRLDELMLPGTCLLAYRGSMAHNMYVPKNDPQHIDDVDLMGVVVGGPEHYLGLQEWGSRGTKEFWKDEYDCVYYELRKMFQLLLQGNPNVLSTLWLRPGYYLDLNEIGRQLLRNKELFVGRHVYNSFAGYASAQLQKMESRDPAELREYLAVTAELKHRGIHPNHKGGFTPREEGAPGEAANVLHWGDDKLRARLAHFRKKGENLGYLGDKRKHLVLEHGYDSKNAAHCVRLLRMAKEFLATGEMQVFRTTDAQELLDIKAGKWTLAQVKAHAEELFKQVKDARDKSALPDEPDREGAEKLLIKLLRSSL
jgi:hypothetical protein